MWRNERGILNTNAWADPAEALGPALALVDEEAEATGLERFAVELEGMENLLIAELLKEDGDPAEEASYAEQWLPPEVVAAAMEENPESVAELVVAVPLRWRLDVLMAVADRVEELDDED